MGRNPRIGWLFAAAALLLLLAAGYVLRPWGWLLAWPALSLGVVAAGYLRIGPAVFRKRDGRLALSTRWGLLPFLGGAHLSWLYLRRPSRPWVEVRPGLIIGRRLSAAEAEELVRAGVTSVLDLTAEYPEAPPLLRLRYANVQLLDLTVATPGQLDEAVHFIRGHFLAPPNAENPGKIYVHCALGYSRAACIVAAYLLAEGTAKNVEEALALLRSIRPQIVIKADSIRALEAFQSQIAN